MLCSLCKYVLLVCQSLSNFYSLSFQVLWSEIFLQLIFTGKVELCHPLYSFRRFESNYFSWTLFKQRGVIRKLWEKNKQLLMFIVDRKIPNTKDVIPNGFPTGTMNQRFETSGSSFQWETHLGLHPFQQYFSQIRVMGEWTRKVGEVVV